MAAHPAVPGQRDRPAEGADRPRPVAGLLLPGQRLGELPVDRQRRRRRIGPGGAGTRRRAAQALPSGVRLVLAFAPGSGLNGSLVRDTLRRAMSSRRARSDARGRAARRRPAHGDDHRRPGRDARQLDGLAAVAGDPGRGGRAGAHPVGLDPLGRARLGPADPARGRARPAAPTTSASPGRCRWPRRGCRPSSPPTRTTPRMRRTPSCRARSPMRNARYNLTNVRQGRQDRSRPSWRRCSACARPSASRPTSPPASRPACATPRRRRRPTRARAAPARPRPTPPRPPTRRSCPRSAAQLAWLGIEPGAVQALEPYVVILPGGDLRQRQHRAARGAGRRDRGPRPGDGRAHRPVAPAGADQVARRPARRWRRRCRTANVDRIALGSNFFEVRGRLRLGDVVLEQRSLVQRRGLAGRGAAARAGLRARRHGLVKPVQKCAAILRRRCNRAT